MIVDDDENMRIQMRDILADYGNVRDVASGMDAVRLSREWIPELIFLDVMMPELDGLATCGMLRANAGLSGVPIVFVTSRRDSQTISQCFRAGGNDFIAKPLRAWELRLRAQEWLTR